MGKIAVATPQEAVAVDRQRARAAARAVLDGEGAADAEVSLAFVDDATIHALNKRYLGHDEPTDVLSFPLSEPGAKKLAGELVIGAEVAQRQAAERGHDVQAELALYVIHGLLHLCGYDDATAAAAAEMRRRERHYLAALGLPDIADKVSPLAASRSRDAASGGRHPMPAEKALALVLRTTDWSETSRIATLWTREFGKVRALAKGGRRLRSNFESALDLLTLCRIVLLRKSSGGLDLLTEAQVVRRFPGLSERLPALYAGYYVAELLADWTEENDPHPGLFDEAVDALAAFADAAGGVGLRLARFELVLLRELGYSPLLDVCAACHAPAAGGGLGFSAAAGGVVCAACAPGPRDRRPLSPDCHAALRELAASGGAWRPWGGAVRAELRQVLGGHVTYLMGRRPRLLPYLQGS